MVWKKRGAAKRKLIRRKRLGRRVKTVNVNRALQPYPQRYVCKLKYADTVSTTLGTGAFHFNLNSLFDPNRTGTGHQPYGYDTFSTLYNRYRVVSCSWRCSIPTNDTTNVFLCAMPSNEVLSFANQSEMIENPRCKYIEQGTSGSPIRILSGKSYIPSLVGRNKSQYMADDRYQSTVLTSPAELAILNLYSFTAAGVPTSVVVNITMEFTVEFFDIKHLIQSVL